MKLFQPFKGFFLSTLAALFASGVVVFVCGQWFQLDRGMGAEPRPIQITVLQIHAIVGLLFLMLFGYLWAVHVLPAWRRRRRLWTGVVMCTVCVVLILTVPFLYYLSSEMWKGRVAWVHTYLGLASVLPFAWHLLARD